MNPLLDKLKKNSTIKETNVLANSILFSEKDMIPTSIPVLNIALSGKLDGGLTPGLTIWAGPSKNFKCLAPDTKLCVYTLENEDTMKYSFYTYGEFFKEFQQNPDNEYFVETNDQSFTRINAMVQKKAAMMFISFDNGYKIECADTHCFMSPSGEELLAIDLKVGMQILTINGPICVTGIWDSTNTEAYDINIDYPHWYVNDEVGIIHHNTMFSLIMAQAYMKQYDDAVMLFLDSEFGANMNYFDSLGIDTNRVIHIPIVDVEQLKFELMKQMDIITRGDHVIIVVDSLGNLASKKEVEDTLASKSTTDMTRAKAIKSLFRMVTPYLTLKNIPMVVIAHSYKTLEIYSKDVVSGGTGPYYSASSIFIMGRQQEKEGTDLAGYNFIINVDKSRYVREKSKIPVTVSFEHGISKYSGLMDLAVEAGVCIKPSQGWYSRVDLETGVPEERKWRLKDTNTKEFWNPLLSSKQFQDWVSVRYAVGTDHLLSDESIDQELELV